MDRAVNSRQSSSPIFDPINCRDLQNVPEVCVFEKRNQEGLDRFLKGSDGRRLETKVRLEILSDFTDETLEGQLADEELGRLLVATDLTESDGTGLVAVRLLDTAGRRGGLASGLGGELLTGGLATSGLACWGLAGGDDCYGGGDEWCWMLVWGGVTWVMGGVAKGKSRRKTRPADNDDGK